MEKTPEHKMYITTNGGRIAGQETGQDAEYYFVRAAAFVDMNPQHTQFNFNAIEFVDPEKVIELRKSGILTRVGMPKIIEERFVVYVEQLDLDAKKRALEDQDS